MVEHINREAFKKNVEERYCRPCKAEEKDHNGCWCRACWIDDMLDEVDCFQSSDVAPVVHGRWIYHDDGVVTCSECGNAESSDSYYCRYCGAKMDGGDSDETD